MNKHVGDQCPKCGLGQLDVFNFVADIEVAARSGCEECPEEEHLHLACTKCGYPAWDYTVEQQQLREIEAEQRAKLS